MYEIFQGTLPSCQTLAVIGAICANPKAFEQLEKRVCKRDDGSYEVNFAAQSQPTIVTQSDLTAALAVPPPDSAKRTSAKGHELVRVLELAYAKYLKCHQPHLYGTIDDAEIFSVYMTPGFHYRADISLLHLTGWNVVNVCPSDVVEDGTASFSEKFLENPGLEQKVFDTLKSLSECPLDYVATAATTGTQQTRSFLDPGKKLRAWHDHTIAEIDLPKERLVLVDPANSRIPMIVLLEDFFKYFYLISYAEVPVQTAG